MTKRTQTESCRCRHEAKLTVENIDFDDAASAISFKMTASVRIRGNRCCCLSKAKIRYSLRVRYKNGEWERRVVIGVGTQPEPGPPPVNYIWVWDFSDRRNTEQSVVSDVYTADIGETCTNRWQITDRNFLLRIPSRITLESHGDDPIYYFYANLEYTLIKRPDSLCEDCQETGDFSEEMAPSGRKRVPGVPDPENPPRPAEPS